VSAKLVVSAKMPDDDSSKDAESAKNVPTQQQ